MDNYSQQEQENLINAIRSRAKLAVIEQKRCFVPDDNSFFALAKLFSDAKLVTADFKIFKKFKNLAPESIRRFFTSANFMLFPRNAHGCISCDEFLRFVQRAIDVESASIQLYAQSRELTGGFMTETELERYIYDLIPDTREIYEKLNQVFIPYYVFTASRRFFFFLDPRRTRRVAIKRLAHSSVMEEFMYFRRMSRYNQEMDVTSQIKDNWFRASNALRLYQTFIDLDQDENGMLSVHELMLYSGNKLTTGTVQLTATAVTRIFEENIMYTPMEMDYKGFLDFILALENRNSPESMMYFFRALDIEKCGRLSPAAIQYFYKDIADSLAATGYDVTSLSNIIAEIYDMLACDDTSRGPTFDEMVKSGQFSTVISMLTDVSGFWQYDNRESLKQSSDAETEEGDQQDAHHHVTPYANNDDNGEYSPDFEDDSDDNYF